MKKEVIINSEIKTRISIDLMTPLQGKLKSLTEESYKKLKSLILKNGFKYPIFLWEDKKHNFIYILDGHQRYYTLKKMKEEKYSIPEIPIIFIPAENIDQAKESILELATQFGDFNKEGYEEFLANFNFEFNLSDYFKFPEFVNIKPKITKVEFEVSQEKAADRYLILIEFDTEKDQKNYFEKFVEEGLKCQIMN